VREFALGDVNEDGRPDLAATDDHEAILFLAGVGDGTFAAPVAAVPGTFGPDTPAVGLADLDLDGHLDLVHSHYDGTPPGPMLRTYRGDGTGSFVAVQTIASLPSAGPLTFADVNGDGAPDIVAGGVQLGFGDVRFAARSRASARDRSATSTRTATSTRSARTPST
jgi:hypothetical protein